MPALARPLGEIPPSPLVEVERLLRSSGHPRPVPLHQGRTWFEPCARPRVWERDEFGIAAHEHAPPGGVPALRQAWARQAGERLGTEVDPGRILVAGGATHAISVALHAILAPGDEVLVLSPQWLFATGLVHAAGGVPREVPVFLELSDDPGFDFLARIGEAVGPRTRAVYFNNPDNPTGYRLTRGQLAGLVALAEAHDLWLIADNAYENYDFTDEGFLQTAALDGAAARTFSVHSCSKTYAMPGARAGYLLCPPGTEGALVKWSLHSLYSVPTASQFAAFEALRTPAAELELRRAAAAGAARAAHEQLEVPHTAVSGGLYTFLDLSGFPGGGARFTELCAREGVGLAPGGVFGAHCADRARVCFTAAPPDRVAEALDRVNKVYREGM